MNNVSLIGRLTADPTVKYNQEGSCVARFNLAVDRRFAKEGQQTADFISCIALGKTGEFLEKYFSKGMRIGLMGRIQTGSYTNKDGQKVYTTDVIAEAVEFVERKNDSAPAPRTAKTKNAEADTFMDIPDGIDDELPSN